MRGNSGVAPAGPPPPLSSPLPFLPCISISWQLRPDLSLLLHTIGPAPFSKINANVFVRLPFPPPPFFSFMLPPVRLAREEAPGLPVADLRASEIVTAVTAPFFFPPSFFPPSGVRQISFFSLLKRARCLEGELRVPERPLSPFFLPPSSPAGRASSVCSGSFPHPFTLLAPRETGLGPGP